MIYVFDLDNTLCQTTGKDYANAIPITERIGRLNDLSKAGHTILIDTARGSGSGEDWTQRTAEQLDRWGVLYHTLRCGVKPPADFYIDDKAINVHDWTGRT